MEKAYLKKEEHRFTLQIVDIVCITFALCIGLLEGPFLPMFVYLFFVHSYLRSKKEAGITIVVVLCSLLIRNIVDVYFYALGFSFFFMLVYLANVWNRNLYVWIPYIVALIVLPFTFKERFLYPYWYVIVVISFLVSKEMMVNFEWIQKSYMLSQPMFACVTLAIALFFAQLMPVWYESILMIGFMICARFCRIKVLSLFVFAFYVGLENLTFLWFIIPLLISIFYDRKFIGSLFLLLFSFVYVQTTTSLLYAIFGFIMFMFPSTMQQLVYQEEDIRNQTTRLPKENIMKRQMQNYAAIFSSLAKYYEEVHQVGAYLFHQMGEAFLCQAEEIFKNDVGSYDEDRLKKALEGYQFDVDMLEVDEFKEGCVCIRISISNIRKKEIQMTVLPLIEGLLQRKLEVIELVRKRFMQGFYIVLKDHTPFRIDVCAESLANAYTSSGDTYSIFKFRQSLVCMISDGMGNGEKAAKSSQLIGGIFQKMVVSGLTQDSAIRCINQLVQGDTFATMDVLCFNQAKGVAYISKSAACPTYLLRDQTLFEVSGNSLPVGIVSQIQPDCFEITLRQGDEFIMMSDGVQLQEIYTWISQRKGMELKEDMQVLLSILKQTAREDDSTIIITKVQGIMG